MDASEAAAFVEYLKHQRLVVDHVYVASCALMVYDYLLTIGPEIRLIWFSPWNYTKGLFFLSRYLPLINVYFVLHNQVLLNVTPDSCFWTFPLASWLITFGMYFAEVILAVRTWAVWRHDRRIGVLLTALLFGAITVECIYLEKFLKALTFTPAPYPGFRGCGIDGASAILYVAFVAVASVEVVVLSLMAISAFRAYRSGNRNELSNVIHRDGIIFYIYLLGLVTCNVVILLALPQDLRIVLVPMQSVLCSAFATRIIINIRRTGRRGVGYSASELHNGPHELRQLTVPMAFRPGDRQEDDGLITSTTNGKQKHQSFVENIPTSVV